MYVCVFVIEECGSVGTRPPSEPDFVLGVDQVSFPQNVSNKIWFYTMVCVTDFIITDRRNTLVVKD